MAIPHLHLESYSRKSGHNACRKAAYNSAQSLVLEGTNEVADFRRHKRCIVESYLLMKDGQQYNDTKSRQDFWGAVEATEKRKDACTCKGLDCALPIELSIDQNKDLALSFSKSLIARYGYAGIDVAYHAPTPYAPRKKKSQKAENPHIHILVPDRDADGKKIRIFYRNPPEIRALRQLWQDHVNAALAKAGLDVRIDMKSYEAQAEAHRQEAEAIKKQIAQLQAELEDGKENDRELSLRSGTMERQEPADSGSQTIADARHGERTTGKIETNRAKPYDTQDIHRNGHASNFTGTGQAGSATINRRSASPNQTGRKNKGIGERSRQSLGKGISKIHGLAKRIATRLDALRYQRSAFFNRPAKKIADRLDALRYERQNQYMENQYMEQAKCQGQRQKNSSKPKSNSYKSNTMQQ